MTEPPTARPVPSEDNEGQSAPDTQPVERARRAAHKRVGSLADSWQRRRAAYPLTTPLQQLLDPARGALDRETPIQSTPGTASSLPEWNALTTRGSLERLPEAPAPGPVSDSGGRTGLPVGRHAGRASSLTTLDETVVTALIQALHDALPDDLEQVNRPETTRSGNVVGRTGWKRGAGTEPSAAEPETTSPFQKASAPRPGTTDAGAPQPRQFVRGLPDPATIQVTRQQLPELALDLPPDGAGAHIAASEVLGYGEACFLRAQSALWAWRTHRQANLYLHTDGPPMQGRSVLIEQRMGPLTLLLGGRVTRLLEHERHWGFTLGSLSDQVVRSQETFLIEWHPDDSVVFSMESRQQLALPSLGFLGSVYGAVRRMNVKGHLRNMRDMAAAADEGDYE